MGRRKKFGEESGFVNVRMPKSKVSEYREAINKLVDEKFTRDSCEVPKEEENKENYEKEAVSFRDFREFKKDTGGAGRSNPGEEDDFIKSIFNEVKERRTHKKEKD